MRRLGIYKRGRKKLRYFSQLQRFLPDVRESTHQDVLFAKAAAALEKQAEHKEYSCSKACTLPVRCTIIQQLSNVDCINYT